MLDGDIQICKVPVGCTQGAALKIARGPGRSVQRWNPYEKGWDGAVPIQTITLFILSCWSITGQAAGALACAAPQNNESTKCKKQAGVWQRAEQRKKARSSREDRLS